MDKPYDDQALEEQEQYEEQPLTDPDVQEDFVLERGEDGVMHKVEAVPEEVNDDVADN